MTRNSGPLGPIMMDIQGTELQPLEAELLQHPAVGGLILFTRNFENRRQLGELVKSIRRHLPQGLIAADTEGGRVQRFRDGFTRLPPAAVWGQMNDHAAAEQGSQASGWLIAAELGELDIDLAFAPVVDVDSGVSEIIGDRAFHREPFTAARLAAACMGGLRQAGMAATAKHFPGHGAVAADSHVAKPVDERDFETIWQHDLTPYRTLIAQGLESVMMAHIVYPQIDALPASFSARWIKEILRERLGFSGAVFCDDLGMAGAAISDDPRIIAEEAVAAGCDMLPVCNQPNWVEQILDGAKFKKNDDSGHRLAALRHQHHCRKSYGYSAQDAASGDFSAWRARMAQSLATLTDAQRSEMGIA